MLERRLQEVRRHLDSSRLDALLVSHLPHVRYLTGFSGSNGCCLITHRKQYLLTDNRYRDQAKQEVRGFTILASPLPVQEVLRDRALLKGLKRVGFESKFMVVSEFNLLKKLNPNLTLIATHSVIEAIAAIKDELEIDLIRHAAGITDRVFRKLLHILKPGICELDLAAEISYWHRRFGADGDAFEPIVASGIRGALPHGLASTKKIRKGELVTLDLGCRLNGYHSDLTRTVALGRPSDRAKRIYHVVLEAQTLAINAARAGVEARELDHLARNRIKKAGYGKYFSHSLGHGVGIEIHESLRLSARSEEILGAGNVVTVEPGIYIPGYGGVRIEDDIVVRQRGCEVLTSSPKELIVL